MCETWILWCLNKLCAVHSVHRSVEVDEGFHNVLSAICSATLGYCGVLKDSCVEVDTIESVVGG